MNEPARKAAATDPSILEARRVLEVEANAILGLIEHLDETFASVVDLISGNAGRVVTMGMGKSGIICKKIS
ncbi:MAG TPA: KpsF/GutQ family sugar-phosphate isomerase, partial [Thermoanaerobaculia bacterium]|nr:KpsF/GutQ family sugar-phosphate isomerase [Thermoanaerobaculia bacterium]